MYYNFSTKNYIYTAIFKNTVYPAFGKPAKHQTVPAIANA